MPRTPPPLNDVQARNARRRGVLARMDVVELRAWLNSEGFGAFGDDRAVLQAAHEARVLDQTTPGFLRRASVRWLRERYPESIALRA